MKLLCKKYKEGHHLLLHRFNIVMTSKKTSNQEEGMQRPNVAPIPTCSKSPFSGFRKEQLPFTKRNKEGAFRWEGGFSKKTRVDFASTVERLKVFWCRCEWYVRVCEGYFFQKPLLVFFFHSHCCFFFHSHSVNFH